MSRIESLLASITPAWAHAYWNIGKTRDEQDAAALALCQQFGVNPADVGDAIDDVSASMLGESNPDILETARELLARIEAQRAHGEALADALEQAEAERDEAAQAAWSAWGTRHEASAQAALHRAVAHYEAAFDELGQWLALVDAIDALEG